MKRFFVGIVVSLVLSVQMIGAQEVPVVLPRDLAGKMQSMAKILRTISAQAGDSTKNADSAKLATQFIVVASHSKDFVPDSIRGLPVETQAAEKVKYDAEIEKAVDLGKQLELAFVNNDNAKVADILKNLSVVRKEGHDLYK